MNKEKVLLTGHTAGVGLSTFKLLHKNNFDIKGISRSNGYDLKNNFEFVKKFIIEYDPDIFINNVYVEDYQTNLLTDLFEEWKFDKKMIINICSVASLIPKGHKDYNVSYVVNKRKQREFCEKINFDYSKINFRNQICKLVNLNFDYVDTNFPSKFDKKNFPNLKTEEVGDLINFVVSSFNKNICFREITIHSTNIGEIKNGT
jgi:hypothetical protein